MYTASQASQVIARRDHEIAYLNHKIDLLESERKYGVAKTFCGVPMREAMQIILAEKEQE